METVRKSNALYQEGAADIAMRGGRAAGAEGRRMLPMGGGRGERDEVIRGEMRGREGGGVDGGEWSVESGWWGQSAG